MPNGLVDTARAALTRTLLVSVVIATTSAARLAGSAGPLHGDGCAASACMLEPPTPDEREAIVAEADRLTGRYADDTSALGAQCRALGVAMRARLGEVRMLPVMWHAVDPEGNVAAVTGDAHLVEPATGAGRVHIARGFDALNPERGIPAIVETARHEFAHLNGMGRREVWGIDDGARLAAACGPSDDEPPLPLPPSSPAHGVARR